VCPLDTFGLSVSSLKALTQGHQRRLFKCPKIKSGPTR
jgi:hypothetical protein